jgi:probable LLM family oxidoreductase
MDIGVFTFADVGLEPGGVGPAQRLPELVEEIALADQVGLDVFGIGEHHRPDFAAPAPTMLLAAAASRTSRIRLSTAVTVLSSDDPVRVFEQFAMLDLLSAGRAEIMAGRGALLESFRIFGYRFDDYDDLFAEKLDLLLALRGDEPVTWSGRHRPPLRNEVIYPRPVQQPIPVWIAVGGHPGSVVRAGQLGLPLALGIIGGHPHRFAPLADLHRKVLAQTGHVAQPLAVTLHGFVAPTSQQAGEIYYPGDAEVMNRVGVERGMRPTNRADFDLKISADGPYVVGSPQQVVDKILALHEVFGHDRVLLQIAIGSIPHADIMRAIELLGTDVAPAIRTATTQTTSVVAH